MIPEIASRKRALDHPTLPENKKHKSGEKIEKNLQDLILKPETPLNHCNIQLKDPVKNILLHIKGSPSEVIYSSGGKRLILTIYGAWFKPETIENIMKVFNNLIVTSNKNEFFFKFLNENILNKHLIQSIKFYDSKENRKEAEIKALSNLISSFTTLRYLTFTSRSMAELPFIKNLKKLADASIKDCTKLKEVEFDLIDNAPLVNLNLKGCSSLLRLSTIAKSLCLNGCSSLRNIAELIKLDTLKSFRFSNCTSFSLADKKYIFSFFNNMNDNQKSSLNGLLSIIFEIEKEIIEELLPSHDENFEINYFPQCFEDTFNDEINDIYYLSNLWKGTSKKIVFFELLFLCEVDTCLFYNLLETFRELGKKDELAKAESKPESSFKEFSNHLFEKNKDVQKLFKNKKLNPNEFILALDLLINLKVEHENTPQFLNFAKLILNGLEASLKASNNPRNYVFQLMTFFKSPDGIEIARSLDELLKIAIPDTHERIKELLNFNENNNNNSNINNE